MRKENTESAREGFPSKREVNEKCKTADLLKNTKSKSCVSCPPKNTHVQYCRIESIRQNNVLFVVDRKNSI